MKTNKLIKLIFSLIFIVILLLILSLELLLMNSDELGIIYILLIPISYIILEVLPK